MIRRDKGMNKRIIRLISGVILTSVIFIGCSNKADKKIDNNKEGYISIEDMEYIKNVDKADDDKQKIYVPFYGVVTSDKENLSVLQTVFSDEYNMDNGYQSGACFIDTTGSPDIKKGDFIALNIEMDLSEEHTEWTGFVLVKGPMSEDEFNEYVEEENRRKEIEEEERKKVEKEIEEENNEKKREEEESEKNGDNITVGERLNDYRTDAPQEDRLYITAKDMSIWCVPNLNQKFFKNNYDYMRREIIVNSKDELGTIRGTFDAEVVLSAGNKIVIAIKPVDKYEYYCLKVDNEYSIGDKFKVTIDEDAKLYMGE